MNVVKDGDLIIYRSCTKKWKNCIEVVINKKKKTIYIRFLREYGTDKIQEIRVSIQKAYLLAIATLSAIAHYELHLDKNNIDILAIEREISNIIYELVKKWSSD